MPARDFEGRYAIVTGASGGIGSRICMALSAAGATVGLVARTPGPLEDLRQRIVRAGGAALSCPADVREKEPVQDAIRLFGTEWGQIDVAVACAGTFVRGAADTTDPDVHEDQWRVSYLGALHLFQPLIPEMRSRRWGRLALISSVDGLRGMPRESAYASGKAAASSYAAVLRQELRGSGVRISIIHPSRTDTPMAANLDVPWVSRKISPDRVARAVMRGLRTGRPSLIVPPVGPRFLWWLDALSPAAADAIVRWLKLSGAERPEDADD